MSPSRPSSNELRTTLAERQFLPSVARYGSGLKSGITGLAFWTAIILPFLHVPLLLTGLRSSSAALAFVSLLALNVVAVIVGQLHTRDQ